MKNKEKEINKSKLTFQEQYQLETWQFIKEQSRTLEDATAILQDIASSIDKKESIEPSDFKNMGVLLLDIRESIDAIRNKDPEQSIDYTKPVLDICNKLEKAFRDAKNVQPNIKVDIPKIEVPDVAVDVDTTNIRDMIKRDLPKALEKAIKTIPKPEKPDNTELLKLGNDISGQLESIENATRMKPQMGSVQVSNLDSIASFYLVSGVNVGQKTSHASTPQQLSGLSIASTNGILVQALASNTNNVYIGGSGVATSTGYELQPGQAVPFTVDNIQDLYVIGGTTSDGVCWNVL